MFGRGGGREVLGGHGGLVRIGIVVLAWTLDPDVLSLSLCPKHQDAIKNYLCSPWVGGCGGAPGRDISQESGSSVECEQCAQGGGSV